MSCWRWWPRPDRRPPGPGRRSAGGLGRGRRARIGRQGGRGGGLARGHRRLVGRGLGGGRRLVRRRRGGGRGRWLLARGVGGHVGGLAGRPGAGVVAVHVGGLGPHHRVALDAAARATDDGGVGRPAAVRPGHAVAGAGGAVVAGGRRGGRTAGGPVRDRRHVGRRSARAHVGPRRRRRSGGDLGGRLGGPGHVHADGAEDVVG